MSKAMEQMQRASVALSSSELILARYRPIRPLGGGSSGLEGDQDPVRRGIPVPPKSCRLFLGPAVARLREESQPGNNG